MSLENIRKLNKNNNIIEDEASYNGFEPQEEDLKFLEFIKQRGVNSECKRGSEDMRLLC